MATTLITYIKDTRYDAGLFRIERISNEVGEQLNIKPFKGKDYIYIPRRKIVPKKLNLVRNRTYELTIKTRMWQDHIIKTFHLDNTIETLSFQSEPKCWFQNIV